jgi:hypothetical protein
MSYRSSVFGGAGAPGRVRVALRGLNVLSSELVLGAQLAINQLTLAGVVV